jgi:hypothetical protein
LPPISSWTRAGGHAAAHALRAGEGDAVDVLVVDKGLADAAAADDHVEHALRQAGLVQDGDQGLGGRRGRAGGLDHHRVAEGQRRRGLPGRDGDREVPGRDQAEDADRLAVGLDLHAGAHGGQVLPVQAQGLAGEILEDAAGADGFADAFRQGLALFARQQAAERLAPLEHQGGGAVEDVRADLWRGLGPGREGAPGGGDGGVDLRHIAVGRAGDQVAGVGGVQALRGPIGRDFLAVDPVGQVDRVGHWRGPGSDALGEARCSER